MQTVVIVGRMNVGKSTLFNRMIKKPVSISYDVEGVTRDFIEQQVQLEHQTIRLLDTGGVSITPSKDPIIEAVRLQSLRLIEQAGVVLFVVDGTVGPLPQESEIAKLLHKMGKQVIVVINKMDTSAAQQHQHEFVRFGFNTMVPVSATHGRGMAELLSTIEEMLPEEKQEEEQSFQVPSSYRVVLAGRPNAGKSSLMNWLLNEQRSIVSDVPGTTREAIAASLELGNETITLVDTAGVRRSRSVHEELEELMVKSSLSAMRQADIVLLLVDSSEGKIADQELKLAFHVFKKLHKSLIILYNKSDLTDEYKKLTLESSKDEYEFLLKNVETLAISCKTGKNLHKIVPLVEKVWQRYTTKFDPVELGATIKRTLIERPLYRAQQQLAVHKVRQISTAPITIGLTVNIPQFFGDSQLAYVENIMRKHYELTSVPVVFIIENRKDR